MKGWQNIFYLLWILGSKREIFLLIVTFEITDNIF